MISSKYSSRRHVPQRPPICNPPLKQAATIPLPPWPPQALNAQATISVNQQSASLQATIQPTYPQPESQLYYANQNGITLQFRLELLQRRLYVDYLWTVLGGQYVYATQSWREITPGAPINESYPPWTTLVPGYATCTLTINST